ncbi:MAG: hypothetical protein IT577_23695 [Verrucomicrobiae bacterium]|nr:hypothetical protein [Verrucomicrobiae bacterium]
MPSTIHRAVVDISQQGRIYDFMRDGTLFRDLSAVVLAADGTNVVHVYAVDRQDGPWIGLDGPAHLDVYVRAADNTGYDKLTTITAPAMADGTHFEFAVPTDFVAYRNREARLGFRWAASGAMSISPDQLALQAPDAAYAGASPPDGSWAFVSVNITGLADRRVDWRCDDPSVALVVQGAAIRAFNLSGSTATTDDDQAVLIIGQRAGRATITARALANDALVKTCAVTVTGPIKSASGLADQVAADCSGIVVGISSAVANACNGDVAPVRELDRRAIPVVGNPEDLFRVTLSYKGTVPLGGNGALEYAKRCLYVALTGGGRFGTMPNTSGDPYANLLAGELSFDCAKVLNSDGDGAGAEALDASFSFFLRGGDTLCIGWALVNYTGSTYTLTAVPNGNFTCEFNLTVDEHYPPKD